MSDISRIEGKLDKLAETTTKLEIHVRERLARGEVKIEDTIKDLNGMGKRLNSTRTLIISGFFIIASLIAVLKFLVGV